MSLPAPSVPRTYKLPAKSSDIGGILLFIILTLFKSYGSVGDTSGAKIATNNIERKTKRANTAILLTEKSLQKFLKFWSLLLIDSFLLI